MNDADFGEPPRKLFPPAFTPGTQRSLGRSALVLARNPQGQRMLQVYVHAHEPRYMADDLMTLVFAVVQGTGASLLPDYMCHADLQAGRMVELLSGWGPPLGITHAMFPARRALVPAVRRLLDFLSGNIKGDGLHGSMG